MLIEKNYFNPNSQVKKIKGTTSHKTKLTGQNIVLDTSPNSKQDFNKQQSL